MSMTPRYIDVLLVVTSIGSTSIFSVDGSVQGFYTKEKEKIILVPRFGDGSKGDRIPSYMHWQWDSILAWGHKKTFRTTY
jgi:hypothetical protein